jgi:hypothetical protein
MKFSKDGIGRSNSIARKETAESDHDLPEYDPTLCYDDSSDTEQFS